MFEGQLYFNDRSREWEIFHVFPLPVVACPVKSPWLDNEYSSCDERVAFLSINPNYITFFKRKLQEKVEWDIPKCVPAQGDMYRIDVPEEKKQKNENLVNHSPDGVTSVKSSSRIKLAINWLYNISQPQRVWCEELKYYVKFKLNLITLTLPVPQIKSYTLPCGKELFLEDFSKIFGASNIGFGKLKYYYSDKFIKHDLLNHFLTLLRRECGVNAYVWRAEAQANGNIHFHISTNKFVYLADVRAMWNRVLSKTDMLARYHEKFCDMSYEQYKAYRNKSGRKKNAELLKAYRCGVKSDWYSPNDTDIHAVYKVKNLAAYLAEYFTKKSSKYIDEKGNVHEERRNVDGCLWRLSELLSKFKKEVVFAVDEVLTELGILWQKFPKRVRILDYASVFCFTIRDLSLIFRNSVIVEKFNNYKNKILEEFSRQNQLILSS
jgi:hypothetical protein